ncbi:MAG: hypothetical protein IPM54_42360 [Polyangiaceae bacterium]|nr:hypothetical protein [Polyangiaceae bacterium]
MINQRALEEMDEKALTGWLVRRMRGEEADPPLSSMHLETPDDFVAVVHGRTTDAAFRGRLENGIVEALREIAKNPDLRAGKDANAVQHLAALILRRAIRTAVPVLLAIAERGILGRTNREIDANAERMVLMALARLQEPKLLAHHWIGVWCSKDPALWPIATAGLRHSDPEQGVALLPEIITRAKSHRDFPLGEVLWAYRADPRIGPPRLAQELGKLGNWERARCRMALMDVGATAEQIDELLAEQADPDDDAADLPTWAVGEDQLPMKPPRWSVAA